MQTKQQSISYEKLLDFNKDLSQVEDKLSQLISQKAQGKIWKQQCEKEAHKILNEHLKKLCQILKVTCLAMNDSDHKQRSLQSFIGLFSKVQTQLADINDGLSIEKPLEQIKSEIQITLGGKVPNSMAQLLDQYEANSTMIRNNIFSQKSKIDELNQRIIAS